MYSEILDELGIDELAGFKDEMDAAPDNRHQSYVQHCIGDIVVITFLAVLAASDEWTHIEVFARKKEAWLKEFLSLRNGIPSHDTIQDVMSMLSPSFLFSILIRFIMIKVDIYAEMARRDDPFKKPGIPIVSIDGKTSRATRGNDTGNGAIKPIHTLHAVSSDYGFCIGEVAVCEKSNEITATPDILDIIDVEGCVVTWDALNTQKSNVKKVIDKKGDYVVALKANHPCLSDEVKEYFDDEVLLKDNPLVSTHATTDKEHNAIIKREYILSAETDWIYGKSEWKNLKTIGVVKKTISPLNGKAPAMETRYYISSVTDVELFARSARGHWQVESFHWSLDVAFRDDYNKTRDKNSARNLNVIKKMVLALLKLVQPAYKMSLKKIRYAMALDYENEIEKIFALLDTGKAESALRESAKIK
jgi:predicted transposase YbfD/YdcC